MDQQFSKLVDSDWPRDNVANTNEKSSEDHSRAVHLDRDPKPMATKPEVKKHVGSQSNPTLSTSIVAGASAGIVVDMSLYPLDTVKTRLQSKVGFRAAGGFRGVYKGLLPVLIGSAPCSALFFATYNSVSNKLKTENSHWDPLKHVLAASIGEVVGSSVRVPLEIVKQRNQTSSKSVTSWYIFKRIWKNEGIGGMYRGFLSTLTREVPFAAIQFPVWEFLKTQVSDNPTPFQTACCGAVAGGFAAALTTPMDVIKTRVMLADKQTLERYTKLQNYNIGLTIFQERGFKGLFAGIVPRVLWITIGGFIYFGVYDKIKDTCEVRELTLSQHEVYMKEIARFRESEKQKAEAQLAPDYKEQSEGAKKNYKIRIIAPSYNEGDSPDK